MSKKRPDFRREICSEIDELVTCPVCEGKGDCPDCDQGDPGKHTILEIKEICLCSKNGVVGKCPACKGERKVLRRDRREALVTSKTHEDTLGA